VDALSGAPLWRHVGPAAPPAGIVAPPGTGVVLSLEPGTQNREVRAISARTGADIRLPLPVLCTNAGEYVAGVQDSRLLTMPSPGILHSWDLITGEEVQVDLGGRREPPVSSRFERGWAILELSSTRLLAIPLPLDPARARVQVGIPTGHTPIQGGLSMAPGNRLLVMTTIDQPKSNRQIQRFQLGPEGIVETTRISMSTLRGQCGYTAGVAGHTLLWGGGDDSMESALVMLHSDAGGRIAWSLERPPDPAAGKFFSATVRGTAVFLQYEQKVVFLR
jgi:hypothetical protein